jgi:predicted DNA-binding transcriptional regulator AlpA
MLTTPERDTPVTDASLHITRHRNLPALFDVTRMTIHRWRRDDPTFPRPVRLGKQYVGYFTHELLAWAKSRREAAK